MTFYGFMNADCLLIYQNQNNNNNNNNNKNLYEKITNKIYKKKNLIALHSEAKSEL